MGIVRIPRHQTVTGDFDGDGRADDRMEVATWIEVDTGNDLIADPAEVQAALARGPVERSAQIDLDSDGDVDQSATTRAAFGQVSADGFELGTAGVAIDLAGVAQAIAESELELAADLEAGEDEAYVLAYAPFFVTQMGPTAFNPRDTKHTNGTELGRNDCGPASVLMLLRYFGLDVSDRQDLGQRLVDVRNQMLGHDSLWSLTMDGATMDRGLTTMGLPHTDLGLTTLTPAARMDAIDAALAAGTPVLLGGYEVPWQQRPEIADNYLLEGVTNHYVVIFGRTSDGRYIVGDPLNGDGVTLVSREELQTYASDTFFGASVGPLGGR